MKTQNFKFTGKKTEDDLVLRKIARLLGRGLTGVFPTDTLYGIICKALNRQAVAKLYQLRERQSKKPFIILISSIRDLAGFGIELDEFSAGLLAKIWPGKISVVLPCQDPDLKYLHRGTESLAFRLPDSHRLRCLLKLTGALVAPSANLEGRKPAESIAESWEYFGDKVDFYADAGKMDSLPSTLIKIENDKIIVLRKGAVNIDIDEIKGR